MPSTPPPAHLVPGTPIRVRDLIIKTRSTLSEGEARTYGSYWSAIESGIEGPQGYVPGIGDEWAHEVLPTTLEAIAAAVEAQASARAAALNRKRESAKRATRIADGHGAKYNAIGAMRKMFAVAVKDRHVSAWFNPTQEVSKPVRRAGTRRPLTSEQLDSFWKVVLNGGDDPELDAIICLTILITAARREGILNLCLRGIDLEACTVRLDEKLGKVTNQPVPDWFIRMLYAFARSRGAVRPGDKVFRKRTASGEYKVITGRRFDSLFGRVRVRLRWADDQQVVAHTLRHHAHALIERHAGTQVAEEFVRHEPDRMGRVYGRATPAEVAQAVISVHGGSHPWVLADEGPTDPA